MLRGPGALQYGGSAVGGVVNVIDNRIPREPVRRGGVTSAAADLGYHRQPRDAAACVLEGGNRPLRPARGRLQRVTPTTWRCRSHCNARKPGSPRLARRICNSANDAHGGAIGGTLFFDHGYLGASASTYRSSYGTVAEDDVTIGMKSDRYALEGEWRSGRPFTACTPSSAAPTTVTPNSKAPSPAPPSRTRATTSVSRPASQDRQPRGPDRLQQRNQPLLGRWRRGVRAAQPHARRCSLPARGVRHLVGAPELRRAHRAGEGDVARLPGRSVDHALHRGRAQLQPAQCGLRRAGESHAAVAADVEPRVHRARAEGLRALRQRPARRDRGVGGRRCVIAERKIDGHRLRHAVEVRREHRAGQRLCHPLSQLPRADRDGRESEMVRATS